MHAPDVEAAPLQERLFFAQRHRAMVNLARVR
jgi:hypothetical protein